jgi:iron complex transport system substrate-binding protein
MRRLTAICLWVAACASCFAAQGIVSTAPSFTEALFALGAGKRVVAVSQFCHYPPDVNRLPRVGSYLKPNIEAIARVEPELVLMHAELKPELDQLASLGIKTLSLRNATLEDTLNSIRIIGSSIGLAERGAQLERELRNKLAAIEKQSEGKPRRSLLFVVGRTPGRLEGMVAVGKGSYLNDVIRIAGGRNALADSPVAYPRISLEAVMRLDPDVIVDMGDMAVTTGVTERHIQSVVKLWQGQTGIRAVTNGNVHAVAADIFVVPGPRVVDAAEAFARMLQPGRKDPRR